MAVSAVKWLSASGCYGLTSVLAGADTVGSIARLLSLAQSPLRGLSHGWGRHQPKRIFQVNEVKDSNQ